MRYYRPALVCLFVSLGMSAVSVCAQTSVPPLQVLDTVKPLPATLTTDAWTSKADWQPLEEDDTSHAFLGDAVAINERIGLFFRKGSAGVGLYANGVSRSLRAVLAPQLTNGRLARFTVAANSASEIVVDTVFTNSTGDTATLQFEMQPGQPFVKTVRQQHAERLRIEAPCRFGVLPDFFASDIALDARDLPADRVELPSENFFLHLLEGGDSIVAAIWEQREQEIEITLTGSGETRSIQSSEVPYGTKGHVYVGVLEGHGVWQGRGVDRSDADRVLPLGWQAPFPAHWRMDWRQTDGLTDSWEMLIERENGEYEKPEWFGQADSYGNLDWMQGGRKRWTTVLGFFQYPCWINRSGEGWIQPLKNPGTFQGRVILYPVNRITATPLNAFTFVDLVRATLGVGPCQYMLDVEGQQKQSAGRPTCDTRTRLNAIYADKQQVPRRDDVNQALDDVLAFMQHIRQRIEDYARFGREMQAYLASQKKSQPKLVPFLDAMESHVKRIDEAVANRRESMGSPEFAQQLVDEFRTTLVGYEGQDALERCRKITAGFVKIGGNQDELVGECRLAVRLLRQQAALAMAADPRVTEIAQEVRRRTHAMLRNPTSYEAPRH
jgi:hypothetical protein